MKSILSKILIFTICIVQLPTAIYADTNINRTLKVGLYDYDPYYFINKDGKPSGYYNDLLELLKKDLNIEYEYTILEVSKCIERLETGEIDLLLGLAKTPEREDKFIYTDHYIDIEKYGIYTNKDIEYGKLSELEGLKFAYIKNEENYRWIYNFLEEKNISVIPVETDNYEDARNLLLNEEVDAISSTITDKKIRGKNKIYEYSSGPVYIAASKGNEELIHKINDKLQEYSSMNQNPIETIKSKYFSNNIDKDLMIKINLSLLMVSILILMLMYSKLHPVIKKKIIKKKIKIRMNNGDYILYYQPIINPKEENIIGFEALLRLKDDTGRILTPYFFIKEIEDNDMEEEISLWILKQIIKDHKKISNADYIGNDEFYISFNLSTKEVENEAFIQKIIDIINKESIKKNTICVEIMESVRINDLKRIKKSVNLLRDNGIQIAIDDFGVEYSNLDVIEKLEFNILKLDKYFIDHIETSSMRREIVNFLSNLLEKFDKSIVAEGVERKEQNDIIKNIDNKKLYIQGFYYSKPLPIERIIYTIDNNKETN